MKSQSRAATNRKSSQREREKWRPKHGKHDEEERDNTTRVKLRGWDWIALDRRLKDGNYDFPSLETWRRQKKARQQNCVWDARRCLVWVVLPGQLQCFWAIFLFISLLSPLPQYAIKWKVEISFNFLHSTSNRSLLRINIVKWEEKKKFPIVTSTSSVRPLMFCSLSAVCRRTYKFVSGDAQTRSCQSSTLNWYFLGNSRSRQHSQERQIQFFSKIKNSGGWMRFIQKLTRGGSTQCKLYLLSFRCCHAFMEID